MATEKVIPWSSDMERTVLATAMLGAEWAEELASCSSHDTFYAEQNRTVFAAIKGLVSRNMPADLVMVSEELKRMGLLEHVGGKAYLSEIAESATVPDIAPVIKLLNHYEVRRRMIRMAAEIRDMGYSDDLDVDTAINRVQERAFALDAAQSKKSYQHIGDIMPAAFEEAESYVSGTPRGMKTGIESIDAITGGLHRKEFVVLAGRPSHGKTALAEVIASHIARHSGSVLFFSQEMASTQLVLRALCRNSGISLHRLRSGRVSKMDYKELSGYASDICDLKLYLDDTAKVTPMEVITKTRKLKRSNPDLCLVIIDYIQLMKGPRDYHGDSRNREVGDISEAIRCAAKELDVCILGLSQLSRALEMRRDKHPQLSDLRETGQLEQDAHMVLAVYRPELYYPKKSEYQNVAEIGVLKQRNGPVDWVAVSYDKSLMKFSSLNNDPGFEEEHVYRGD